jgi:precorrin-2 dehydrogenase/sirohydrochlorin ferrochelatase
MSAGYPIVLEVSDRLVVIVGGGAVALRKARGLLASGARRVTVVAPQFHPEMPAEVQRVVEAYRPEHLAGASLVFAATDCPDVNDAIVRDAGRIGALVCRADADEDLSGDFATPAMLRQGALLVTVSSGGSPALSAMIRDRFEQTLDPRWAKMAAAMQELRPVIRKKLDAARRRDAFRALCSDEALTALDREGVGGLRTWLTAKFEELART